MRNQLIWFELHRQEKKMFWGDRGRAVVLVNGEEIVIKRMKRKWRERERMKRK